MARIQDEFCQALRSKGAQLAHLPIMQRGKSPGQIDELLAILPLGFELCACAADPKEAEALAHLAPPMIAVEPLNLLEGTSR